MTYLCVLRELNMSFRLNAWNGDGNSAPPKARSSERFRAFREEARHAPHGSDTFCIRKEVKGMASFLSEGSRLILKVQTGSDEWGKPKSKTLSWRGIDPEASADDVDAVANALAGLCLYPRLEVQKQDTDLVTA
jgi:hypothetical protein